MEEQNGKTQVLVGGLRLNESAEYRITCRELRR
jgi:hypothetical protein